MRRPVVSARITPLLRTVVLALWLAAPARGGDILRGGTNLGARPDAGRAGSAQTAAQADRASANARDSLARTSRAMQDVQAMQAAARALATQAASAGADPNRPGVMLPTVPEGLAPGGLVAAPGITWQGATLPVQSNEAGRTLVTVEQQKQTAVLTWESFNIGRQTTLRFDQSAGGADRGKWIAFNKVQDPTGRPSQILGSIEADGQVYVVNGNGIIFGGASQVNVRTLVASSLPINDNLIASGLLNNRDAQFLFSATPLPGGADGTPAFTPEAPVNGTFGDVVVQPGARIQSLSANDGNGGRVMLVGPKVTNAGTISTPAGQTILAAGQQVAIAAHDTNDPSLRGLDVFVGAVAERSGIVVNAGLIEAPSGSVLLTGRRIEQNGVIASSTAVDLNGRIDLRASYGSIANPEFDNAGGVGPPFVYQQTGVVSFGPRSATTILPDSDLTRTVPGTALPANSQINVEGLAIYLESGATMLAPGGDITVRAGTWPTVTLPLTASQANTFFPAGQQRFFFSGGQIYADTSALISVAGSTAVASAISQRILDVQFRGPELADSPLQRDGPFRGVNLTVDLRRTGTFDGRFFQGTPLGDVTGLAGLIQRNATQLTANGGTLTMQAGGSIVVQYGAQLDVSGGFLNNEGGMVRTTRLRQFGRLVEIADATPDQVFDGIFTGQFTETHPRFGITKTFAVPFMSGARFEPAYVSGAAGGSLTLTAPSMAIDGELRGATVQGPRDRTAPPAHGQLSLAFLAEQIFNPPLANAPIFVQVSPLPPRITFAENRGLLAADPFLEIDGVPQPLRADRSEAAILSPGLLGEEGFGRLSVENSDGGFLVPGGVKVAAPAGGSVALRGANLTVFGEITAPGGSLSLTAFNLSPTIATQFNATPVLDPLMPPAPPAVDPTRGQFYLDAGAALSTAGLVVDERADGQRLPLMTSGGSIVVAAYSGEFQPGSLIDVSGGARITPRNQVTYGNGGSIDIRTGRDPGFARVVGGEIELGSTLKGFSGATGGTLAVQAGAIQIGGAPNLSRQTLRLEPVFFQRGGFTNYALTGIGLLSDTPSRNPSELGTYTPAIDIGLDVVIEPRAERLLANLLEPGTRRAFLKPRLNPVGQRSPVSVSFTALGFDEPSTIGVLDARGDIVMDASASIAVDPSASVSFNGQTVTLLGSVSAPGGSITVAGAGTFPFGSNPNGLSRIAAQPTVFIGAKANLSTVGTAVFVPDNFGRRIGTNFPGGPISVSGNIVAEAGAVLDVSGSSAVFDVSLPAVGRTISPLRSVIDGLRARPFRLQTQAVARDGDAGAITLAGSEMLFSDATLRGFAGGPTALGGTLSVSSGLFFADSRLQRNSAQINLRVSQADDVLPETETPRAIGLAIMDADGVALSGGRFTADRVGAGGFDSLDLGFAVRSDSILNTVGGNVQFDGPVSIVVPGTLRVASGGVISADAAVALTSSYLVVGQPFRAPDNPNDPLPSPFLQGPLPTGRFPVPPTTGTGNVFMQATLIDVGTLSLQGIERAELFADRGDIRGNGSLNIAGDLTLRAGQVYPTTLSQFDVFAFDRNVRVASSTNGQRAVTLASAALPPGFGLGSPLLGSTVASIDGANVLLASGAARSVTDALEVFAPDSGSITVIGSGFREPPISIGGRMGLYAAQIEQRGVLRAPLGTISIGYDGTDLDPSTPAFDQPVNLVTQPPGSTALSVPVAANVTLRAGSLTSVSMAGLAGVDVPVPFGLSPDGSVFIDPRGENITLNGVPAKKVSVRGAEVRTETGSDIDLRGGGDLLAFRFVSGNGGSIDILGTASAQWSADLIYQAGDLVNFRGETFAARVRNTGMQPSVSASWTLVPESFAIIPGFTPEFAPFAPFNTDSSSAQRLAGDPGLVSNLRPGAQITLEASPGLPAGTYTLLPRRFAVVPGSFLIRPTTDEPMAARTLPAGESIVSGRRFNAFSRPEQISPVLTRFEVLRPQGVRDRVQFDNLLGNSFFAAAAKRFEVASPQRLPIDAGDLAFHGNLTLRPEGSVLTFAPVGGRGARVDLSSFADIEIVAATAGSTAGSGALLSSGVLNAWGAESLVIGGLRRDSLDGTIIDVRAKNIRVANSGSELAAPDIALAASDVLSLAEGAAVRSSGSLTADPITFLLPGNGALVRVSADPEALAMRTGAPDATLMPLLKIAAGARVAGPSVTIDSTYATTVSRDADIRARALTFGSGQISVLLSEQAGPLAGEVVPGQLVLVGGLLRAAQAAETLTLRSGRTIDIYGAGLFKSDVLNLLASGVRGFEQAGGSAVFDAGIVSLGTPGSALALAAPAGSSGDLSFNAGSIQLGEGTFTVAGYDLLTLRARSDVTGNDTGALNVAGSLSIISPLITGTGGSDYRFSATGAIDLQGGTAGGGAASGLGASMSFTGPSIVANTRILLPSGQITLRATTGNVAIGGVLDVSGARRDFYDAIRYSDGGSIIITSDTGDVALSDGARLTVSAPVGGGSAGTIRANAPGGAFRIAGGQIEGLAGGEAVSGSFFLDARSVPDLARLGGNLNAGGFFEEQNFRIRTGDIVIADVAGQSRRARHFTLSTDLGNILVQGKVDASGTTGGSIALIAGGNLTLAPGALLNVHAAQFSSSGQGGTVLLEAGAAVNGVANLAARLDLQPGSIIDLGVDAFQPGRFDQAGSSAFLGQFTGKLHLRAPRNATNSDLGINPIGASILGASSILAEGYQITDLTSSGGLITGFRVTPTSLPANGTVQRNVYNSAAAFLSQPNHDAMIARLLGGDPQGLQPVFVLAPGAEIINRTGDLVLGRTNSTALGSASSNSADWDLADFRFGPRNAPGVLTLRAAGNVTLFNALSDGFRGDAFGTPNGLLPPFDSGPGVQLLLSPLQRIDERRPVNLQSWSYRIAAGSDLSAADFHAVRPLATLGPISGSLQLGKFYSSYGVSGANATTESALNNRYQVIRTGTGSIDIAAGRDVQLRNQTATIYTAGVRLPNPTSIFAPGDFSRPTVEVSRFTSPSQGALGAVQQIYPSQWSLAGGDVTLAAQGDIRHVTGSPTFLRPDTSYQLPTNWLYRRGDVDPTTGTFGPGLVSVNEFDPSTGINSTRLDLSASTTWWIDFSNYFQGIGALGGGDVRLTAGGTIMNIDATIPTNARMPGLNPATGARLAPDASRLVQLGGGDLTVRAGGDIDGGLFYVERGRGTLFAGGSITTNGLRSTSGVPTSAPETWLPATVFVGDAQFDVSARGDVLIGPASNAFLLPQGLNNKFYYKTYFNTFSADAALTVASFGGSVTHRLATVSVGSATPRSILNVYADRVNLSTAEPASTRPWIRLAETDVAFLAPFLRLNAPTITSTAFAGDLNIAGQLTLQPSPIGGLELVGDGGIIGLHKVGTLSGTDVFTSAVINVSDAAPARIPGITNPIAYRAVIGDSLINLRNSPGPINPLVDVNRSINETGSFTGQNGSALVQQALHAPELLHLGDPRPVRLYAGTGDITAFTLFSPKRTRILAGNDIADISFYIQNVDAADISVVSSGRDLLPFNENTALRAFASNASLGNRLADLPRATSVPGVSTVASAGDIQINGPGTLEVLAGRDIDLGTGPNLADGTGAGITSIGNFRNPALPFIGADVIVLAGVTSRDGLGAAGGLSSSSLDFTAFLEEYATGSAALDLGEDESLESLDEERRAIAALALFYDVLRQSGRAGASTTGAPFDEAFAAIETLFGTAAPAGQIFTRARDIRTSTGGSISLGIPGGGLTLASDIFGNPLTPPGIVTEFGGPISIFTNDSVDIAQARIFTLRGGDILIFSSTGDIAAGTAPRTVVTAPPTRVVIDVNSANVQTDLGGLATGGGIGALAAIEGVPLANIDLIAPVGTVDAGDAGIRVTGNLSIAAVSVLNASNIQVGGTSAGVPSAPTVAAPNLGAISAANSAAGSQSANASDFAERTQPDRPAEQEAPSIIVVEVLGYGGG